jgi:hypothetical protein
MGTSCAMAVTNSFSESPFVVIKILRINKRFEKKRRQGVNLRYFYGELREITMSSYRLVADIGCDRQQPSALLLKIS